jgi:hypothetical protein
LSLRAHKTCADGEIDVQVGELCAEGALALSLVQSARLAGRHRC